MTKEYMYRAEYSNRIRPFIDKQIIKVLTGQRRVGKSYILLQLIDEILKTTPTANIIFIDKELESFSEIRNNKDLYSYVDSKLQKEHNYLFIDEVQEIESFELCLRSLLNEDKCDIFCTGSNAQILSGELATHLAGRYIAFPIHSFSYSEFLSINTLENSTTNLIQYLTLGGMPYLSNLNLNKDVSFEYLKNVYASILLKDVVARENIRNVAFLENLITFLADNTGSIFAALNISKYLKSQQINLTTQTVLNYLLGLRNAFFIYRIPRIDVNGLKIFEVGEKYYFEDLGLRNAIRTFDFKKDVNKLMENAVCMHLIRNQYKVYVGKLGDKEIDFVAEKNGERMYIQVCYMLYDEAVIQREFGNLMQIRDQYPKYVVTFDEIQTSNSYMGIKQMHLREFLDTTF